MWMRRCVAWFAGILLSLPKCPASFYYLKNDKTGTTYDTAFYACNDGIPDSQADHEDLVHFLRKNGLKQTWLDWRIHPSPWLWLSGKKVQQDFARENAGLDCATLSTVSPQGQLEGYECNTSLPTLCQFNNVSCSKTYAPSCCVAVGGSAYVTLLLKQSWHKARSFCHHLGGDMATIPKDHSSFKHVLSFLRKQSDMTVWIGARRGLYWTSNGNNELDHMRTNQWDVGHPVTSKKCTVLHITESGGFWRSASCSQFNIITCNARTYSCSNDIMFIFKMFTLLGNSSDFILKGTCPKIRQTRVTTGSHFYKKERKSET